MRRSSAIRTAVLLVLAVVAGGLAAFAPSASAASYSTSSYASRLLSLVNAARADNGLAPLRAASGTTTVAAGWTAHMASSQTLAHNPDLRHQIETNGSPDWGTYGENVGQGVATDPDGLFHAYMQSPEHRANILTGAYRYVGVAVQFTGRTAWNTFDFVDTYGTPAPTREPAQTQPTKHHTAVQHRVHAAQPQATAAASPVAPAAAKPARADHHRAAAHRPAHHAAADRHRSAAPDHRTQVRGLRTTAVQPFRGTVVAEPTAAATSLTALPAKRSSRAVLVAVAVLALVAAARRWTLTVARG